MEQGRVLRLFLVGERAVDHDRAALLVDRLAARRVVGGKLPEWWVLYEECDTSEAMRLCEADLTELDPRWPATLDFVAIPSRPILGAEFG